MVEYIIKLVNVVSNGDLNIELDLNEIEKDIRDFDTVVSRINPGKRLVIEFHDNVGTVTIFRTGKYNIMGCKSIGNTRSVNKKFLKLLSRLGIIDDMNGRKTTIVNYVFSIDIDAEIELSKLKSLLGERAEYEPEQNPFVIYKPENIDCTMTISNSGKCVVNTPIGEETVHKVIDDISNYLE